MIYITVRAMNLLSIERHCFLEALIANVMPTLRDDPSDVGLSK